MFIAAAPSRKRSKKLLLLLQQKQQLNPGKSLVAVSPQLIFGSTEFVTPSEFLKELTQLGHA